MLGSALDAATGAADAWGFLLHTACGVSSGEASTDGIGARKRRLRIWCERIVLNYML